MKNLNSHSNTDGEALEVLIVFKIVIDGFLDDICCAFAVLVDPVIVIVLVSFVGFLDSWSDWAIHHRLLAYWAYMVTRLQVPGVNSILMEALPLLKSLCGLLMILLCVPIEHLWSVGYSDALAKGLNDFARLVEKVIGIHNEYLGVGDVSCFVEPVCTPVDGLVSPGNLWSNAPKSLKVVKQNT